MTRVAVVEGLRSPFAVPGTCFAAIPVEELARAVVRELIERSELDGASVDEVILGNVAQPPGAPNLARVVAVQAGLPLSVPAHTVARNCASGLEAVTEAFDRIRSGQAHTVIAGGAESASDGPLQFSPDLLRTVRRRAFLSLRPGMLRPCSALRALSADPLCGKTAGEIAEGLAKEFRISRADQDAFVLEGLARARQAEASRRWAQEIVPIYPAGETDGVARDGWPREEISAESLADLPPLFDPRHGTVTEGNRPAPADGAAALLLMSEARVRALGLRPLAWVRGYAYAGTDPRKAGLAPALATALALRRAGLSMREVGLVEIHESSAAELLALLRLFEKPALGGELGADLSELAPVAPGILNVNGGSIALGNPVGASGARVVLTLARQMRNSNAGFGLASVAATGGQGGTLLLENA